MAGNCPEIVVRWRSVVVPADTKYAFGDDVNWTVARTGRTEPSSDCTCGAATPAFTSANRYTKYCSGPPRTSAATTSAFPVASTLGWSYHGDPVVAYSHQSEGEGSGFDPLLTANRRGTPLAPESMA